MATGEKIEVTIIRDRVQFERVAQAVCLCGDSHQDAAMHAWVDFLAEAGVDGQLDYGCDITKCHYFVREFWQEGEEDDEEEQRSRVWWPWQDTLACAEEGREPSAEVLAAWRAAQHAESDAWVAAAEAATADCSTTDKDRAEDEQARYWLGEMRQAARDAERATLIQRVLVRLRADGAAKAREIIAAIPGKSRSTRKRAWRKLRAAIGAEATAELQAALMGFARRN